ncbi:MAG: lipoprotein [Chlorobi bacterium]|nr:lipoprotein [Chlorobiota bacterium]
MIKTDGYGNVAWRKQYGNSACREQAYSITQTTDNGYMVAGYVECPPPAVPMGVGDLLLLKLTSDGYIATGNPGGDIYVVRVLSNDNLVWAKSYAGTTGVLDMGYDVQRTGANYLVAGVTNNSKAFLMRLRSDGTIDFSKAYAPPGATSVARSVVLTDRGYAISGDVSSGNSDLYLVKTDGNGDSFCNTENLTLLVTPQAGGASIHMETPAHTLSSSDDATPDSLGLNQAQLCYKEEYPVIKDISLSDIGYAHVYPGGVVVGDDGHVNDPIQG